MGMSDDLKAEVNKIIKASWQTRDGGKVPETEDIQLGNNGVYLDATCLYADLAESTAMVNTKLATFSAEIYKCFLNCACRIIRYRGGVITAFDGDRVMAVFIGTTKNTAAARSALGINYAVAKIINPALQDYYGEKLRGYQVKHAVGIDTSRLLVARTGIRGSNDLVWVGPAANYAAKLCSLRQGSDATWITASVYRKLNRSVRFDRSGAENMWREWSWADEGMTLYRSSWSRAV